jgi:hypothetical protein
LQRRVVRCGISYSATDRYNEIENSQEFAMPKLNRDGVNIHYEIHGSGPPLLLTHGYSSTSAMWRGQIEALSKQHKLILWDMRGHGQSDYPDDAAAYSEALTVGDMACRSAAICRWRFTARIQSASARC